MTVIRQRTMPLQKSQNYEFRNDSRQGPSVPLFLHDRIILDLCGGTGSWSRPYRDAGYQVIVVDIKQGQDVRLLKFPGPVHGILAAPDCTHLAGSGARWWKEKGDAALLKGLSVVDACIRIIWACNPVWWALENPRGRLSSYLGPPRYTFDPCDYGDPYTKRTCLWGTFTIPERRPVDPVLGSHLWKSYGGRSERTKTMRSVTPSGFADAFFTSNP